MAQKTDLNVSPYYDDFDTNDNYHRVLFRPGFAVQARELTQLQSILQNQIEIGENLETVYQNLANFLCLLKSSDNNQESC